ncbi:hypothetical protein MPH_02414 [Macrophomina phaseolina MS6]|uniref:Uncharacterized protein n=1 Tax=Macrophomina phaseolina (strain MS6) TaxID=1126212 RepID=K2RCN3_MACPH|nr:hypothetical protein MPH_02414 [Macrophomina phaseolina MS6]
MSGKWSKSSHSVALDYITSIETFSIVPAARRRHWAVFTALIVGFICGALVAVANSLTYIDLFATASDHATFTRATAFDFNETLEKQPSQNLSISYTHEGQQPYAAVAAERLPNGQAAPWTKDSYVFESFTNTSTLPENATMEAQMKAFYPGWTCHPIDLVQSAGSLNLTSSLYFKANTSKQAELNCSQDTELGWSAGFGAKQKTFGWLNLTACDENGTDLRLISVLGQTTNITTPEDSDDRFNTTLVGVMCSPSFTLQDASVRVNQSTGEVVQYTLSSEAAPVDIQTSMSAIYIYLINPMDGRSQEAFATNNIGFSYNIQPRANITYVLQAVGYFVKIYDMDPFTSSLTDDQAALDINSYLADPGKLKKAVEQQSDSIVAQVVNSLARKNTTEGVEGELWIAGPKMFLRETSLRALQAFLFFIAVTCVFQSTLFRPKTVLREDPGSIAARATILAGSSRTVERAFAREAVSSERHMNHALGTKVWRLKQGANGSAMLEAARNEQNSSMDPATSHSPGTHNHDGFRPLALRFWAKWGVIATLLITMAALAVLMGLSQAHDGICKHTSIASDAFAFVPTVVFLLLGYACSGIDGSVRIMAPYKSLWNGPTEKKQPLLFNVRDSPSVWDPYRAIRNGFGIAVAASSFAILLIPAIKIVAAGLHGVQLVQKAHSIQPLIDMSFVDHLQDTFSLPVDKSAESYSYLTAQESIFTLDIEANIQSASQYTEWSMNPDFDIPVRSGILDNLVFANLTDIGDFHVEDSDLSSAEITVNVPAIAVDVACKYAPMGISASYQNCSRGEPYFTFYGHCETAACNSTMNVTSDNDYSTLFLGAYSQAPCQNFTNRFQGLTFLRYDMGYQVVFGDFQPIQRYVANTTFMNDTRTLPATASMFNITSLPTVFAAVCYSNLTHVTVDTTFSRKSSSSSNTNTTTNVPSAWSPIRYDAATIKNISQIPNAPYWLAPLAKKKAWDHYNQYDITSDSPGQLDSPSLWPTRGSSASFFELLASYATYSSGNLSALLDPPFFVSAAQSVYTSYTTNMLTQLRPWARNESGNAAPVPVMGSVVYQEARIFQDFRSTVALEVCLGVMAVCFVWVALRFPSEALLPKSPGSVAATAALVAGSRLVEGLRREGVASVEQTEVWTTERAGLGWWEGRKEGEGSSGEGGVEEGEEWDEVGVGEKDGMRWGIDVGEGVVKGSWKEPAGRVDVE